ncbi:uncharacterized protein C8R40DRAFT_547958 [Lentinula edodes]|uniref:uncharacterized protein n=1 Tax=Lentinula edodes TaxID=5353 RepID=UPI001E8D2F1C|nr:uncharacterized protein C8R40DRAFT_547958 [Lentinula edodes]KAH7871660.1 hypothetical protein C8R40DRAFT_547958 [Lentinula edodes]
MVIAYLKSEGKHLFLTSDTTKPKEREDKGKRACSQPILSVLTICATPIPFPLSAIRATVSPSSSMNSVANPLRLSLSTCCHVKEVCAELGLFEMGSRWGEADGLGEGLESVFVDVKKAFRRPDRSSPPTGDAGLEGGREARLAGRRWVSLCVGLKETSVALLFKLPIASTRLFDVEASHHCVYADKDTAEEPKEEQSSFGNEWD